MPPPPPWSGEAAASDADPSVSTVASEFRDQLIIAPHGRRGLRWSGSSTLSDEVNFHGGARPADGLSGGASLATQLVIARGYGWLLTMDMQFINHH